MHYQLQFDTDLIIGGILLVLYAYKDSLMSASV